MEWTLVSVPRILLIGNAQLRFRSELILELGVANENAWTLVHHQPVAERRMGEGHIQIARHLLIELKRHRVGVIVLIVGLPAERAHGHFIGMRHLETSHSEWKGVGLGDRSGSQNGPCPLIWIRLILAQLGVRKGCGSQNQQDDNRQT